MTASRVLIAGLMFQVLLLALGKPGLKAPAEEGEKMFARRCSGCHATDINKEGPRLRGVYGRKAATVPEFNYSDSLKALDLRWDETTLDRWLTDPEAISADTDMAFRLSAPEERKVVIAYLKSLRKN